MSFTVGSLVRTRDREWVVLPESQDDFLVLRPLAGANDQIAGVHTALEAVEPATFKPPDPSYLGDYRSARLLRDAVRLSSRAGAGPFRAFSRIAVEPRPYQIVPLLMALRQETVRLLIADDVGIGKTVESALIARELLDRGEIERLAVLCPPHLADQWEEELRLKFHIDAERVLPSTAARLERPLRHGESLFEYYPYVVVSLDYIKSDRRRDEFARSCPEFVIVDEAHTCSFRGEGRGRGRHQRHDLIQALSQDSDRHMVFVTATPHSGNEDAFRSLLTLLNHDFADLPSDLSGEANRPYRTRLAKHLVQRRRADIKRYLDTDTPFPDREEREDTYGLGKEYQALFDKVLTYARERVRDESLGRHRQRVRWWAALGMLRSLASSPAAAAQTLRNRSQVDESETMQEADELGRRQVLDDDPDELDVAMDVAPGAVTDEAGGTGDRRKLLQLAKAADALTGAKDKKLQKAIQLVDELVGEGHNPIVFCRYIATVDYVVEHLRKHFGAKAEILGVTGRLSPTEREQRIADATGLRDDAVPIVLVCTDCLSEGINLQDHFDAVMHYDLSWNPTRHEQREGRVDRFGQKKPKVRALTYYGIDNGVDGIVLNVLIRKHRRIRKSLGVSVPVPVNANQVMEAIFEGLLLREEAGSGQEILPGFEDLMRPQKERLHGEWQEAADRERAARTIYAQETIRPEEVAAELDAARAASGSPATVERFTLDALRGYQAVIDGNQDRYQFDLTASPPGLKDLVPDMPGRFGGRFEYPAKEGDYYLSRTHPLVERLAGYVLDGALDPELDAVARRAGVIRTDAVAKRTTLLLCRFRFDIVTKRMKQTRNQLAEECGLLAFEGAPAEPEWLEADRAEQLLEAEPAGNINADQARPFIARVLEGIPALAGALEEEATRRAGLVLEAHARVRAATGQGAAKDKVEPQLPVDLLGVYVYLPAGGAA